MHYYLPISICYAITLLIMLQECEVAASPKLSRRLRRRRRHHRKLERRPNDEEIVSGFFIVDLYNDDESSDCTSRQVAQEYNITIQDVYTASLNGFAAFLDDRTLDLLLDDSRVDRIAPDGYAYLDDDEVQNENATRTINLDMIDGKTDGLYSYKYTGYGSHIYVVDSGIRATHQEFGGGGGRRRRRVAPDCFDEIVPCNTANINNPHWTHIASIAAGTTYGIAKNAILHDVRVQDESNKVRWSGLIKAMDYITQHQQQRLESNQSSVIVNMSLGGGANTIFDKSVTRALEAGAILVAAAGNKKKDACSRSPARVPSVITVGSISHTGRRSWSTNHGPCVDIWAIGMNIRAAGIGGDSHIISKTGTSMAAPAVAGAMALYLEAGKTVDDLLEDAAIHAELAGNDESPARVLSLQKLNAS